MQDFLRQHFRMSLFRLYKYIAVFFVTFLTLSGVAFADDPGYTPCTSSICQKTGEEIINSIDNAIDPCEDFFQHACGRWVVKHTESNSGVVPSPGAVTRDKARQDIKDLLVTEDANDAGAIRKAKDFYKTCVDQATLDNKRSLMAVLTTNGDWPLTVPFSQWNPQHLTWQQIHEYFMNVIVYPGLFDFTVKVGRNNSKAREITLISPEPPGSRADMLAILGCEISKCERYKEFVLTVAQIFTKSRGFHVTTVDVEADITALLEFEAKLINASKTDIDNGSMYRIITIKESQDIWDSVVKNNATYKVDWLETIKRKFESTGIVIDENEKLALESGVYLQRLATLLLQTPIRTIVNYIHWYAIIGLLEAAEPWSDFLSVLRNVAVTNGIEEKSERSLMCSLFNRMHHAIFFMYVKKHFTGRTRASVLEIIQELHEVSKEKISNSTWMDENARKLAKEKIDAMVYRIGYPDWYDEPGKVDEYYNELTVGPDYYKNILAANRFESKKRLLKLRKPFTAADIDWIPFAFYAEYGYDVSSNSHTYPADMLQMPIFHYEKPAALRFGIMGAIIGHEIFHGFDNAGRLRDKDGNERQLWSSSTINEYEKKTDCFIKQYSQHVINENSTTNETIYVDGVVTLNENLNDNAGFSVGFKAFQRYKSLHPNENVKIPALKDYSDEKLYFYGLANILCETLTPQDSEHIYITNPYSPDKVRVNGALSNMNEFANTFACPTGNKMNPTNKCVLWD